MKKSSLIDTLKGCLSFSYSLKSSLSYSLKFSLSYSLKTVLIETNLSVYMNDSIDTLFTLFTDCSRTLEKEALQV